MTLDVTDLAVVALGIGILAAWFVMKTAVTEYVKIRTKDLTEKTSKARGEVRGLAELKLDDVVAYSAGMEPPSEMDTTDWLRTYMWSGEVVTAAKNLGPVRRHRVQRRLRRIVGDFVVDIASKRQPNSLREAGEHAFVPWISRLSTPAKGHSESLLDRAMCGPRNAKEIKQLRRELTQLAAGR